MADATFDGVLLRITLPPGQPIVDVAEHIYTPWKEFLLSNFPVNGKFPPAFRTIGGDALTPGVDAGAYFFLRNDLGWRIIPSEEDASILLTGNLAPEDSALPILVPTAGDFTVLVQGLQPITQSVESLLTAQQDASFGGTVWVDLNNGTAGTEYPKGTASSPVDNLSDAFTISTRLGLKHIMSIDSALVLDRPSPGWRFGGAGASPSFDVAGFDVGGSSFHDIGITGSFSISDEVHIEHCHLFNGTDFTGDIHESGLGVLISLKAGSVLFAQCYSHTPGLTPAVIDCNNVIVDLSVRGYDGGLRISNFSQSAGIFSVVSEGIRFFVDGTVSDGRGNIHGVGSIRNESVSPFVLTSIGFLESDDLVLIRKIIQNKHILDPDTGTEFVLDDTGQFVEFERPVFEDKNETTSYRDSSEQIEVVERFEEVTG